MTITREVIYDMLPAYFAGELSADSRALIEAFFASDPEFGRMAERFRTLMADRARPETARTAAQREWATFDRIRTRTVYRQLAAGYSIGALVSLGIAFLTGLARSGLSHPGVIIAMVWGAVAAVCWLVSLRYGWSDDREPEERVS